MVTYEYRGFDQAGAVKKGLIEALDPKEARERLVRQGILPESVDVAGAGRRLFGRRSGFSADTRSLLYRELAALLAAGFTVVGALELLMDSPDLERDRTGLAQIRDALREGRSFSGAFGTVSENASAFELAVLDVGERTASMAIVLNRLADFLEEQSSVKDRLVSALFYPCLVFVFAIAVAVFMLVWVLPGFVTILVDSGVELPLLTRVMMQAGALIGVVGVPVLLLLFGGYVWLRRQIRRDPTTAAAVDRFVFKVPVVRTGYGYLVNLRFSRTLSILLNGGVGVVEGLGYAAKATGSPWVESLMDNESKTVSDGGSVADALRRIPPLAVSLPGWIQAGEASGSLPDLLEHAASRFQTHWERFMQRAVATVEPALIVAVGVFVLVVMLAILLPVMRFREAMAGGL